MVENIMKTQECKKWYCFSPQMLYGKLCFLAIELRFLPNTLHMLHGKLCFLSFEVRFLPSISLILQEHSEQLNYVAASWRMSASRTKQYPSRKVVCFSLSGTEIAAGILFWIGPIKRLKRKKIVIKVKRAKTTGLATNMLPTSSVLDCVLLYYLKKQSYS